MSKWGWTKRVGGPKTHLRPLSKETLHSRWQSPRRGTSYYISLFPARPLLPSSWSRPAPPGWHQAAEPTIADASSCRLASRHRRNRHTENASVPAPTNVTLRLSLSCATGRSGRERLRKGLRWQSGVSLTQRPTRVHTGPLPARSNLSAPRRERNLVSPRFPSAEKESSSRRETDTGRPSAFTRR